MVLTITSSSIEASGGQNVRADYPHLGIRARVFAQNYFHGERLLIGRKVRMKPERLPEKLFQVRSSLGLSQVEMLRRLGLEDIIDDELDLPKILSGDVKY